MEFTWGILGQFANTIRLVWQAIKNRPQVTCDIHGVYGSRWCLDYLPEELGGNEGILIEVPVEFLLANNGPADTTIKDVYINVRYARIKPVRFAPLPQHKIQGVEIGPRKIWGPHMVTFSGSLWNITEPPKDSRAELVVEPVAQQPVRRQIKLFL